MFSKRKICKAFWLMAVVFMVACEMEWPKTKETLELVTYKQFKEFVESTGYVTDAEKFGWSFVQYDVFTFYRVNGANWKKPDGKHLPETDNLPVTQVSYNDAMAYCQWSGFRLPSYSEYWRLIENDDRKVIMNNERPITNASKANVLGNVWEITGTCKQNEVRLAGGSVYCSAKTCNGTVPQKEVYIDKTTGNLHIGFAVVK